MNALIFYGLDSMNVLINHQNNRVCQIGNASMVRCKKFIDALKGIRHCIGFQIQKMRTFL